MAIAHPAKALEAAARLSLARFSISCHSMAAKALDAAFQRGFAQAAIKEAHWAALRGFSIGLSKQNDAEFALWRARSGFPKPGFEKIALPGSCMEKALGAAPWDEPERRADLEWLCDQSARICATEALCSLVRLAAATKLAPPEWAEKMRREALRLNPDLAKETRMRVSDHPAAQSLELELDESHEAERSAILALTEKRELEGIHQAAAAAPAPKNRL